MDRHLRRLERRRSFRTNSAEGGWTLGLVLGAVASYWLATAARDGSLAERLETVAGAWSHVGAVGLLLVVGSQGWPRFVSGFAPVVAVGMGLAAVLSRQAPDPAVRLFLPLLALGVVAAVVSAGAVAWQHALRRGGR